MSITLSHLLASYVDGVRYEHLPRRAIEKAKTCLLHDLGIALASYVFQPVQIAISVSDSIFGSCDNSNNNCATVLVKGSKVPPAQAVFINSVMFDCRAQEDTHHGAASHFGSVVIPISLALGESLHRSGKEVIEAIVAGYQVGAAVGSVSARETITRGFRPTSLYGGFAGTVAAGKLLRLGRQQLANAISLAANFALGLNETWIAGSMEWSFQVGIVATNALMGALLAKAGGIAAETALEGRAGFYRAYAGLEDVQAQLETALKKNYQILDVTFKPYAACAINQSPIIAVLELLKKNPLNPKDVSEIKIKLNPAEASYQGIDNKSPLNRYGASLMSTQFCVASALKHKRITLAGMLEFDDPVINELMSKTEVIPSEGYDPFCCGLEIETKDGRKLVEEVKIPLQFYDYTFERDLELLRDMLPEMRISPEKFEKLVQELIGFETLPDVAEIVGFLIE